DASESLELAQSLFAAEEKGLYWPWLILEAASAGVFLHAGIKFPYFVFFNQDKGLRPKEAPVSMLIAMGILAFLCLFLGIYPKPLYDILPYHVDYTAWTIPHVVAQSQLLVLSALVFFLFLPLLKRTATISLDTDWFYRKGGALFYRLMDRSLNAINAGVSRVFLGIFVRGVCNFFESGAPRLACFVMGPIWAIQGLGPDQIDDARRSVFRRAKHGAFPIGMTAFFAVILLGLIAGILMTHR
ncbi:MAG TPA: hypothetical protein PK648_15030, partial [Verrucomicrobiales bacterium]|nr:hypothetical protein [Verrucomicrobiales bacterium]